MFKGILYLNIPIIGRVITIWGKLFFKVRVSFDVLISRKKVFWDSSHRIETHLDVVVEVLEFQRSVAFELCIDEYFIEFMCADLTFYSPHATNFCIMSTIQWWIPPVSWYHSGTILGLW